MVLEEGVVVALATVEGATALRGEAAIVEAFEAEEEVIHHIERRA